MFLIIPVHETFVSKDSITFYLTVDDMTGMGILAKTAGHNYGSVPYDQYGLWGERVKYGVKLSNPFSTPIKEITLTEDAESYDQRLFVEQISPIYQRGNKTVSLDSKAEIRAYKADGDYDVFKPGNTLNSESVVALQTMADRVNHGEILPKNTAGFGKVWKNHYLL